MRRIVTGACLVSLMATGAYAADNKAKELECIQQLISAEELVHNKIEAEALSEAEAEKINLLLDEADALCTDGDYKKAKRTLNDIDKMVTPPAQ